jgi:hypothetical protein
VKVVDDFFDVDCSKEHLAGCDEISLSEVGDSSQGNVSERLCDTCVDGHIYVCT